MQVLLISPLDPDVPHELKFLMGGENTYTRMLLANQPKGMEFTHVDEAIKKNWVSIHPLHYFFLNLQKLRILPPGPRVHVIEIKKKFDLVYAHGFPVKTVGMSMPLVFSDSSSNIVFLRNYLNLPKWKIEYWQSLKKKLYRQFDISDTEVNFRNINKMFVFSKWARSIKNNEFGVKNCDVIYPGLPIPKINKRKLSKQIKILFVGVWFERKGGRILLQVFRTLHNKYKNIHLTILGELPYDVVIGKNESITHKNFVPYKELLKYYQSNDILVHIPPQIEGYGMTVTEAMSYGMCCVVSDICVLPEFIQNRKNGLVVKAGSAENLELALTSLINNPKFILKFGKTARKSFIKHFSLPVFHKKLFAVFNLSLRPAGWRRSNPINFEIAVSLRSSQ